jgi:triosephosphate isomerase
MEQPDVDGALVGGACLKLDDFLPIVEAARGLRGA